MNADRRHRFLILDKASHSAGLREDMEDLNCFVLQERGTLNLVGIRLKASLLKPSLSFRTANDPEKWPM